MRWTRSEPLSTARYGEESVKKLVALSLSKRIDLKRVFNRVKAILAWRVEDSRGATYSFGEQFVPLVDVSMACVEQLDAEAAAASRPNAGFFARSAMIHWSDELDDGLRQLARLMRHLVLALSCCNGGLDDPQALAICRFCARLLAREHPLATRRAGLEVLIALVDSIATCAPDAATRRSQSLLRASLAAPLQLIGEVCLPLGMQRSESDPVVRAWVHPIACVTLSDAQQRARHLGALAPATSSGGGDGAAAAEEDEGGGGGSDGDGWRAAHVATLAGCLLAHARSRKHAAVQEACFAGFIFWFGVVRRHLVEPICAAVGSSIGDSFVLTPRPSGVSPVAARRGSVGAGTTKGAGKERSRTVRFTLDTVAGGGGGTGGGGGSSRGGEC